MKTKLHAAGETLVLLILIFFISNFSYAQVTAEWTRNFEGQWSLPDFGREIRFDANGNVYVAGHSLVDEQQNGVITIIKYNSAGAQQWVYHSGVGLNMEDFTIDAQGNCYAAGNMWNSNNDFLIVKVNSSGQQAWQSVYNDVDWDIGTSLIVDVQGNIFVTGYSITFGSNYDIALVKFNNQGQQQWAKKHTSAGNLHDFGHDVKLDDSGNIYIAGYLNAGKTYELAVVKYNPSGELIWSRSRNLNAEWTDVTPAYLEIDRAGDIIVCGNTFSQATNGDILIDKYDSSGAEIWSRTFNTQANDSEYISWMYTDRALTIDAADNIYIICASKDPDIAFSENIHVAKYNPQGDIMWTESYMGAAGDEDIPFGIAVDDMQNVYVCGYTNVNGQLGGEDYITIKYNAAGTREWVQTFNGNGDFGDQAHAIAVDNFGNVYVTGISAEDQGILDGNSNIVTIKYAQTTGVVNNGTGIPSAYALKQNYPNPFNPSTNIEFNISKNGPVKLQVYNSLGKVVSTLVEGELKAGSYTVRFSGAGLTSGVYFYMLQAEGFSETKKMLLVK